MAMVVSGGGVDNQHRRRMGNGVGKEDRHARSRTHARTHEHTSLTHEHRLA